jgi:hypothetical protein
MYRPGSDVRTYVPQWRGSGRDYVRESAFATRCTSETVHFARGRAAHHGPPGLRPVGRQAGRVRVSRAARAQRPADRGTTAAGMSTAADAAPRPACLGFRGPGTTPPRSLDRLAREYQAASLRAVGGTLVEAAVRALVALGVGRLAGVGGVLQCLGGGIVGSDERAVGSGGDLHRRAGDRDQYHTQGDVPEQAAAGLVDDLFHALLLPKAGRMHNITAALHVKQATRSLRAGVLRTTAQRLTS